ncbi:alpha-galactosidase [Jatrophihabitans telluris]|uniref:alpha-galactosidase n=1 Tax=Jatrophihabitans telluris TaxID=2038343 RepID=A0ABY4QWH6_9ACTN|nr:alpha-galactosidase [Jatrophihabitans telluris]UQX87674.1 alpha-galactosidase [Jatrophihabitans telluris]
MSSPASTPSAAEPMPPVPLVLPALITGGGGSGAAADGGRTPERTGLVLIPATAGLPRLAWLGVATEGLDAADIAAVREHGTGGPSNQGGEPHSVPVLGEVSAFWFGRPGLEGHRLGEDPAAGHDWSTAFTAVESAVEADGTSTIRSVDEASALQLLTEIESLPGGALRIRHELTNLDRRPYVVNHLDVAVPVDERVAEVLDLTGRWGRERAPQRHRITDGLWLRDVRAGRPNFESPTQLVAGTAGFGFGHGHVWGLSVAWSGNTTSYLERQPSGVVTLGGGELLLPGEIVLGYGESYRTPWVILTASHRGLDGLAAQLHRYVRSLPAHPSTPRPVVCNVWEAVYFDHNLDRLKELADRAAEIGIERFVLDDGWFGSRRDDTSGLGDWTISPDVWPDGLGPIVEHVRGLGMSFGLWFEPEMVNPDSELYRAHPEWILQITGRRPLESRNQWVLDLGRAEVRRYLFDQISAVLSAYPIEFVKWDHNRPLADAGSGARADAAGVHSATAGYYLLLEELRRAHPEVEWESCASGGGRIDLGVIERVERFWTSDMTDALSRQQIQRWTGQLVPPEYLGAHVSAPTNHQTGRQLSLDFRCATAFFGSFGVEWDVTAAGPQDRARLAAWIESYKQHRALLHGGRSFRGDLPEESRYVYGVVSADADEAIAAYVQLDETVSEPGPFLVPGLDPARRYRARQIMPEDTEALRHGDVGVGWRGQGLSFTGAVLAEVGLPAPYRGPETSVIVHLVAE